MREQYASRTRYLLPSIGVVLVAGLTIVSGLVHGRLSRRWGPSPDILAMGAQLKQLPVSVGGWSCHSEIEISKVVLKELECAGYVSRDYVHQESGETISLNVLSGPSGPMCVHSPEWCLPSRNYRPLLEEPAKKTIEVEDQKHEFWLRTFQSRGLDGEIVRIYYAWTTDGRWSAPRKPRLTFATQPFLYKVQLVRSLSPGEEGDNEDPGLSFLRSFVPVAQGVLSKPFGE